MAVVLSNAERRKRLGVYRDNLRGLVSLMRSLERIERDLIAEGADALTIKTTMDTMLTGIGDARTDTVGLLIALPLTYKALVKIGMPAAYNYAVISPVDPVNAGRGTIRVNSDRELVCNPFGGVFLDNDFVKITNAGAAANNDTFRLWFDAMEWHSNTPLWNHLQNSQSDSDFSSTWTGSGSGHWTLTSTTATHVAGNTTPLSYPANSTFQTANNKGYLLKFTVSSMTTGSLTAAWAAGTHSRTITANGTYECIVTTSDITSDPVTFTPTSGFDGVVSGVSMRRWTGLAFDTALGAVDAEDDTLVVELEAR